MAQQAERLIDSPSVKEAVERLKRARIAGPVFRWDSGLVAEYCSSTNTISGDWSLVAAVFVDEVIELERLQEKRMEVVRGPRQ